jgi:hypothetical protein
MKMNVFLTCIFLSIFTCVACDRERSSKTIDETSVSEPILASGTVNQQSPLVLPGIVTPGLARGSPLLTDAELAKYVGHKEHGQPRPDFEIWYNTDVWELRVDSSELYYRNDSSCSLKLQVGPTDIPSIMPITTIVLAGRQWTFRVVGANLLGYSTSSNSGTYIFRLHLPDEYNETSKSICQLLAEEVIGTFSIVGE